MSGGRIMMIIVAIVAAYFLLSNWQEMGVDSLMFLGFLVLAGFGATRHD